MWCSEGRKILITLKILIFIGSSWHNFYMRNSQLFIKKLDLAEKIDLSHVKLKTARTKSSVSFKTKTKRSSLDFNSKLMLRSQFNTFVSLQSYKSSELLASRNSPHSQGRRFHEEPAKNLYNNYQFFPKRSLLVKPHIVKNTKIALNLFGKKMIANEQRLSVLAQSLYKQLYDMQASNPLKQTATHTPRKPRVPTRAQSAPFQRKESIKFQPWEIRDFREDENR